MVTYAQQTDPNKARISSIDTTKVVDTKPVETPIDTKPVETPTKPVVENKAPEFIWQPKTATKQTTTQQPTTTEQAPDWIWQPFVNNAKIVEKKAQAKAVETSKRLATTNASVIATDYKNWWVSAMELQALKESDPLKFQEVSLALEKQNTLDAINMNQEQFLTNYQKLTDTYMQARESMLNDTTGKELRQQVFEQYWLNKSNDMIKNYTTQIDRIDDEIRKLEDWTGTGDAMMDRWELVRKGRDLSRQRMDEVRARQAEVDYYRLWLEQADAVVKDYKEAQWLRMWMMEKQFEIATGMSTMEFEMKDQQNKQYLAQVDEQIGVVKSEIQAQQQLEQNIVANTSLLSLYDEFSNENKAMMAQLDTKTLELVLKKVDDTNKNTFEREMKLLWYNLDIEKHNRDMKKYWLESRKAKNITNVNGTMVFSDDFWNVVNTFTPWDIDSSGLDITQIIDFCTTTRGRSNVQCWELVNDYWKLATGARMWVENTFASKVQAIQSKWQSATPVAWGVFAYDVGNYWHTGIVTKVFPDWSIETLEANIDWTELWSPPVTKRYSAWQYSNWTFSQAPKNNKMIEQNAMSMIVWIWWTESERKALSQSLIERSQQFWGDLKKAKADLWLITKADQDFIDTRKKDIEWLKKSTFTDLAQARNTMNLINAWNWNGITDTATIVWFLKTIDPASVARESEVASVQNAVSVLWWIEQKLIQAKTGEKLTKSQREQIQWAMKTIISAADKKYSDAILDYVSEFEERGIDYTNYLTTVDMKKVIQQPVKSNIQFWVTNQSDYERRLYGVGKSEEDYL